MLDNVVETCGDTLLGFVRRMVRTFVPPFLPPSKYLDRPLKTWPPIMGMVHDIRLPRRTKPLASPSATGPANIKILLAMIDRTLQLDGDIAECGVFRGGSLVPMAVHLRQVGSHKRLFGFDSFQGFDDSILLDISMGGPSDPYKRVGGWRETSCSKVMAKLRRFRIDNVTLIPGYFRDSLRRCADRVFSFVHLDIGTYDAYKECLEFFHPRMGAGGIILVNDYDKAAWPGCNKAVDEFLHDKPERLELIEFEGHQKFYICRQ